MQWRNNLVLSLASSYDRLWSGYRKNTQRNITKAKGYGCYVKTDLPLSEVLALAQAYTPGLAGQAAELSRFEQLFETLREREAAIAYGCYSASHQLLAAAVFLFSNARSYYILAGNHPNGKTLGASHLLIDGFISDHAGQNILLDFEGSDLPSLAFFYTGFGGKEERYPVILLNRLPFYARWLKG
jgi:lipid II:glycine glycyltransferase (peptidoglycan interpeptide bridge formation enzyme)